MAMIKLQTKLEQVNYSDKLKDEIRAGKLQ